MLVELGLTEAAALAVATSGAAALLEAPDLGRVAAGAIADLCAFRLAEDEAPTLMGALAGGKPALVLQRGRPVRGTLGSDAA